MLSDYYDKAAMTAAVARGQHRDVIGGLWDEIGELQFAFLKSAGLQPHHRLLDIGCGSLRLGVRAVDYLLADHYWGTDLNRAFLDAGFDKEIVPTGLADKLPRTQLIEDGEFGFAGIPAEIDFAFAGSVFTHLPLNHVRLCLANLAAHVPSPCTFFFTIFTPPDGKLVTRSHRQPDGGKLTHPHRDPYHYLPADIDYAAAGTPWSVTFIGDWGHPKHQRMVRAIKGDTPAEPA